jgi:membrane-bound inhibitor of C-type lysozyme
MLTIRKPFAGLVLLGFGALAGCGSDAPPPDSTPGETKVVYSCEGGKGFGATFRVGHDSVLLDVEGQALELAQTPSTSGVAYTNGVAIFHFEGLTGYSEGWPGGDYIGCTGTNT